MAEARKRRRPPAGQTPRSPRTAGRTPAPRQRREVQFRPDRTGATIFKTLRLTQVQRMRLLKWTLYSLTILLALVLQDVIMGRVNFLGATTNLPVCVILLITVIEGVETGSVFVLIASLMYYFSGTAPLAHSVALLCVFGILASLLRQMYLHRSRMAIVLCAGLAAMGYELGLFVSGITQGLTRWDRIGVFFLTDLIDILTTFPLYSLIEKIGLIGGNTWKE